MADDIAPDPPVDATTTQAGPEAGDAGTVTAQAQPLPPDWDQAEQLNLVPAMMEDEVGAGWLKQTASRVLDLIKSDIESCTDHMDRVANQVRLFAGRRNPKNFPFEDSANVHLPILCEAILRNQGRMADMIIPPSGEFFHVKPTGFSDTTRATIVEEHLNWQTRREMKDWRVGIDNTQMQSLMRGSAFRKVYRDVANGKNCAEYISAADFIVPYSKKSTDPMMSDVPRKTHRLRLTRHELEAMEDGDYYYDVSSLYESDKLGAAAQPSDTSANAITEEQKKVEGVNEKRPDDPDRERVIYECHCWLALPKLAGADFGERQRPVILVIDEQTAKVLSLIIREDDDPMDRVRFEREQAQVEAKRQMQAMLPTLHGAVMAQNPNATPEDVAATMPPPPEPIPDPAPVKKRAIECFIHYWCFDNPEGFYGFGLGYLLEGPNEVADSIMNQILDAGSLANTVWGLIDRNARAPRGERELTPGTLLEVDPTGRSLDDIIKIIQWPGPNPAMFQVVEALRGFASEISQDSEALSGDGSKSRTATEAKIETTLAIAEIAVIVRRFLFSLDYEIKALARLNSVYLDDETPFEFAIADKLGNVQTYKVTRRDYLNDLDIEFTAEARMASTPQRIEEAQKTLETIVELATSQLLPPQTVAGLIYAATRSLFEAMNRFDLVKILGPAPQTQPPMGMAGPPMPGGPPTMSQPPAPGGPPTSTQPPQPLGLPPVGAPLNESQKVEEVIASGAGAVR